jgi:hypothetical protein
MVTLILVTACVFFGGFCLGVWCEKWTQAFGRQERLVAEWRRRKRIDVIVPLPRNWGEG